MIVINVLYTVKPGQREAFYALINSLGIAEASRKEPGNFRYDYFYSADHPDQLLLFEQWQDNEALTRHAQTPHFAKLQGLKAEWLDHTEIQKAEA